MSHSHTKEYEDIHERRTTTSHRGVRNFGGEGKAGEEEKPSKIMDYKGDPLTVVHYNPTDNRGTEMRKHIVVQAADDEIKYKHWK